MLKKLDSLRIGRGFAALFVVLYHVEVTLGKDKYLGHSVMPFFNSGYSGVHYFFVLSGFLMAMLHHSHFGRPEFALSFLRARIIRIYPPLWMCLFLVIIVYAFSPSLKVVNLDYFSYLSSFLALPISTVEPFLAVEWTLRYEIIFYLIIFFAILNIRVGLFILIISFLGAFASIFLRERYEYFFVGYLRFFFSEYFLLFFLGTLGFYWYNRRFLVGFYKLIIIFGLISFLGGWFFGLYSPASPGLNIYFGCAATVLLVGFAYWEEQSKLSPPKFILLLGDASYSIYLIHFIFVSLACKIIILLPRFLFSDYLYFVFAGVFSVSAGLLFYLYCERRILYLTRRYLGS